MSNGNAGVNKIVIIGSGPAGLAACDRLCRYGVKPLVLEKDDCVGGLSRTIRYKGNYFDIGGHRFYTRNKAVLDWWQGLLKDDFLKVPRSSRIFYRGRFFHYPISLPDVLAGLGLFEALLVAASYLWGRLFCLGKGGSLEDWTTRQFGRRLYRMFFKDYSEKVWGLPCARISADWAAERIRGVSFVTAIANALLSGCRKKTPKTLIKEFFFPRFGSGMMYEASAASALKQGAEFKFNCEVIAILHDHKRILALLCKDKHSGNQFKVEGGDFISTMPLTDLVSLMSPPASEDVLAAASSLRYRALVMVYLLSGKKQLFSDNWIYVNSSVVKVARIQNFGRWSEDMLLDPGTSSLGMEYFCDEADAFWSLPDAALVDMAKAELAALGLASEGQITDGFVLRVPKAYPVYEKDYGPALAKVKDCVAVFSNLQCIGRNGMFHYNSMDHPILSGFAAAENLFGPAVDLWSLKPEDTVND